MLTSLENQIWIEQKRLLVKQVFVDSLWQVLSWLALIGLPLSLLRVTVTGWLPAYGLHIGLSLLVWAVFFCRRHLFTQLKIALFLILLLAIGFAGLLSFGLSATSACWLALAVLVAHLLLPAGFSRGFAVVVLLLVVIVAIAFIEGWVQQPVDLNNYVHTPVAWINFVISNLILLVLFVRTIKASQSLMQAEAQFQFRQWIEELPLALEVLDQRQQLYYQNAAARQMAGTSQALNILQHQDFFIGCHTDDVIPVNQLPSFLALQGQVSAPREFCVFQQGRKRAMRAWGWPGYLQNGEVGFGIAVFEDISEQKQLEQLKNDFVATVSHELRTPLTAIRGAVGLLLGRYLGELPESAAQMVQLCQQNTEKLLYLVNDLLDMQKIEQGKLELNRQLVDVAVIARQSLSALQTLADEHHVQWQIEIPEVGCCMAILDPQRLGQVLTNLLVNAVKFSFPGDQVTVQVAVEAKQVVIEVIDTGEGMSAEFQQHVFEPFRQADHSSQRHRNGTGLGLSISKALVEQMQGEISFVSELGKGTRFTVTFAQYVPLA